MRVKNIIDAPTVIDSVHESCYRSYQMLEWVKSLLGEGVPSNVILNLISEVDYIAERNDAQIKVDTIRLEAAAYREGTE